jgi:amino acid adenylation domain-containing protein
MTSRLHDSAGLSPEQQFALLAELPVGGAGAPLGGTPGGLATAMAFFPAAIGGETLQARLERALVAAINRHDALRGAIAFDGSGQTTLAEPYALQWDTLPPDAHHSDAPLRRWYAIQRAKPFDLARGETIRAAIVVSEDGARVALAAARVVADEASLFTLLGELSERSKRADLAHDGAPGPGHDGTVDDAVPFQYSQFVDWRLAWAADDSAADGAAYWRDYLTSVAGTAQTLKAGLAIVDERIGGDSAAEDVTSNDTFRRLDAATMQSLSDWAESIDVDIESVLVAAWWILLHRLSGNGAVAGAWYHDCRTDYDEMRHAIGAFEVALPVVDAFADPTEPVDAVVARFARTLESHRDWQEAWPLPGDAERDYLRIGFARRDIPLGQAGWVHEEAPDLATGPAALTLPGASSMSPDAPAPAAAAAAAVTAVAPVPSLATALLLQADFADGTPREIRIRHRSDAIDSRAAAVVLDQYLTLLNGLPRSAQACVSALSLESGSADAVLGVMAGTSRDVGSALLPARIADWSRRTPDAPALIAGDLTLSYAALARRVDQFAAGLAAQGVVPGDTVAMALPRSINLVVTLLAIWRVGAAYLPLDPLWPASRRIDILASAAPRLVVTASGTASLPLDETAGVTHLTWREIEAVPASIASLPVPDASRSDLAYVLFTSGSTGKPKGVMIEHGALLNYTVAVSDALSLDTCRRFAMTSSVAADLGNTMLFGALFNGVALVIASDADLADSVSFAAFMQRHAIDCMKFVPSHLDALLENGDSSSSSSSGSGSGSVGEHIRARIPLPATIVLGGEPASERLLARLARSVPSIRVFNHYGPTETTIGVAVHACTPTLAPEIRNARAGRGLPLTSALANCRLHVLDDTLRPAAVGAIGHLYVGGAQLARGYVGRAPTEGFVDDPFEPGAQLYATGDLARRRADGAIELAGRADDQVKIRGFRVEPAEIERALLALPRVRQAVVRPWRHDPSRLLAYLVADEPIATDDQSALLAGWRNLLRTTLPDYMVPATLLLLDALPRLVNGKVDRAALPVPDSLDAPGAGSNAARVPPRTAVETWLLNTVGELLGREALSMTDDFFELGGHSLLVVRLATRIRKLLKVDVAPAMIFDCPRLVDLAAAIVDAENEPGAAERVAQWRLDFDALEPAQREALLAEARLATPTEITPS